MRPREGGRRVGGCGQGLDSLDVREAVPLLVLNERPLREEAAVCGSELLQRLARLEERTVLRLQGVHLVDDGGGTHVVRVREQAAAEGGEAGAEDHAKVDGLGVLDEAFLHDEARLVDHEQHAPVHNLVVLEELVGREADLVQDVAVEARLLLLLIVLVESLLVLLAQKTVLRQLRHGAALGVHGEPDGVQPVLQHRADVRRNVKTNLVQKPEGAHRHAELKDPLVDLLGVATLLQHASGLRHVHSEHTVHEESGAVLDDDGLLADLQGQLVHRRHSLLRGLVAGDDLDERHLRDRVEEVHAHDVLGVLRVLLHLVERQRRGVRREDRLAVQHAGRLEVLDHLHLQVHHLHRRLHDDLLAAQALVGHAAGDKRGAPVGLGTRHLLPLRLRVELLLHEAKTLLDEVFLDVLQVHSRLLRGEPVRHAAAHHAGTDDAEVVHLRHVLLLHADLAPQLLGVVVKKVDGHLVLRLRREAALHEDGLLLPQRALLVVRRRVQDAPQRLVLAQVLALRGLVEGLLRHNLDHTPANRRAVDDHILRPRLHRLALVRLQLLVHQASREAAGAVQEAVLALVAVLAGNLRLAQPDLLRLLRVHLLPLHDHLRRSLQAHQLLQAHSAAHARDHAQQRLGQPDLRGRRVRDDAVVAGQRQLQPAAERQAVDRRNDGHGQLLQTLDQSAAVVEDSLQLARLRLQHGVHGGQVGAHAERVLVRRQHHHARLLLRDKPLHVVQRRLAGLNVILRQRVGGALLRVHHDPCERVAVVDHRDLTALVLGNNLLRSQETLDLARSGRGCGGPAHSPQGCAAGVAQAQA
eukprot:Rhum_TRINITY_DN176_c0_g1::Rhum_TRINITY_DN176_c0_g1_i1::g.252::m.252